VCAVLQQLLVPLQMLVHICMQNQIVSGHPERHSFPNDGYERERGARGISLNDAVNLRSLCPATALRDKSRPGAR